MKNDFDRGRPREGSFVSFTLIKQENWTEIGDTKQAC